MITGIDDESSEEYHSYALRILIPILDDPMSSLDENLLAAAVLLRLYEEMCDVDTGTHLVGCARLWNNIPDFIAQGGLSEAASWIMLRQNLHISLIKGEPMQVDLNKYRRSRSFVDTTDEDFANRIILLCCQVLATCFSPGAQPDYETWAHLGKEVASWHDSIPAHYSPYHHSDVESTSTGVKSAFPIVWMMNPAQVMGYQHYCLARILLHISEPRLWVSSLRTIEHRVAADKAALKDLHIAIGLGIHNPSVVGAGFTVHHLLFTCGCLLTNPVEQQEVLRFIDSFGRNIGWPYTVLFEIMPRFIPLLLPDQHQGAIPGDAIHRDNMGQRREQCRDPDKNIDLDVSVVYSTDALAAKTSTVDSAQPTWLSGPSGNSFSRVSPSLLDPFNTLCESPERLRQLLRYRRARDLLSLVVSSTANLFSIALAKAAGEPLFRIDQQTHSVQFQGLGNEDGQAPLLTHKSLFHALSLLLALAANDYQQNYETMHHRSQVLQSLNQDLSRFGGDSTLLHTITAILMLISYEYRVRDTYPRSDSAATHIHGLQSIISQPNILTSRHSVALVSLIQRALLWQDIICSLATGAPRLLQVDNRGIFTRLREDQMYRSYFFLPQGFLLYTYGWPASASTVFEDLNAFCGLVDTMRRRGRASISLVDNDYMGTSVSSMQLMENMDHEGYPLCNSQANLQIRLVDLLSGIRRDGPQSQEVLIYRACLFAAYLCTYRLSEGFWGGYFAPEKCVTEILNCMTDFARQMSPWKLAPEISLWLLYMAGGLTKVQYHKNQATVLVGRYRCFYSTGYDQDWELVEMRLKDYIWCEHMMKETLYRFWQQCQIACK
ncbi:hypothetical protein Forpe1208_v009548 [Fusarium oxysporum f. sp. rapae]|uniref:Transcription factor domain-containing protein n=1 Tax=Fusarium oxysporum f. sp. rapae TaxID=485398 RepID=A0A8J5P2H4_FUSOX|nr:hypothetical protein Forpe1208_v009548 [Fusarium oxysporum f. sp. rapae]